MFVFLCVIYLRAPLSHATVAILSAYSMVEMQVI